MVLEAYTDPILRSFLNLSPLISILLLSFILSVIMTLVYKFMTNQELMKSLKIEMKESQKRMKELKSQPEKMMVLQKKVMEKNMKYMLNSFKPMIINIFPIIIIFGWLGGHYEFVPIAPGEEFITNMEFFNGEGSVELKSPLGIDITGSTVQEINDNKAEWNLVGEEGEYILEYFYNDKTYLKEIIISTKNIYKDPVKIVEDSDVKSINIEMEKLRPFGNFELFGWRPGWFGSYILFSIAFSMGIRKLLKIH